MRVLVAASLAAGLASTVLFGCSEDEGSAGVDCDGFTVEKHAALLKAPAEVTSTIFLEKMCDISGTQTSIAASGTHLIGEDGKFKIDCKDTNDEVVYAKGDCVEVELTAGNAAVFPSGEVKFTIALLSADTQTVTITTPVDDSSRECVACVYEKMVTKPALPTDCESNFDADECNELFDDVMTQGSNFLFARSVHECGGFKDAGDDAKVCDADASEDDCLFCGDIHIDDGRATATTETTYKANHAETVAGAKCKTQ